MDRSDVGRFVWYELMTTDPEAAHTFYSRVVGWKVQPWAESPEPYAMWVAGDKPIGGVMKLPEHTQQMGAPSHWYAHVAVNDVDESAARAEKLGGRVLVPPTDIPTVGRFSILHDPAGAVIALFRSGGEPMTPGTGENPGEFSWHELVSSDPEKSWAFYSELFGWQKTEGMDMGPEHGVYQMFAKGGKTLGGYMKMPPGWPGPSTWCYYANVPKLSTAVEAIKTGGGKVVNGPMQVPGGDWVVQALDPQGAYFALFSKTA